MDTLHIEKLKELISLIVISDDPSCTARWGAFSLDVYILPAKTCFTGGRLTREQIRICGNRENKTLGTPWVLFLEPDEFLESKDLQRLAEYCVTSQGKPSQVSVERFVPKEKMEIFSWVTTGDIWKDPVAEIRKYLTRETRLVPAAFLDSIKLVSPLPGSDPNFLIHTEDPINSECQVLLSREMPRADRDSGKPDDWEIFRNGHQRYFEDTLYSERFAWPHTVYHTIRYDHVSHVISALKMGLSNPEIVMYALVYLLRFHHFEKTLDIINLIPRHWYSRYPSLANAVATAYFINGRRGEALALYRDILKIAPDSDWIAQNAIKLHILAAQYDPIDGILERFQKATGKQLQDDYLAHFRRIHGTHPRKTATISACMIVRDEEQTLERAIASLKPVADEIIVVDTGSTDRTVSIAESLGDRVYRYPWSDDFSAARNFAIEKATCDYIFMLDADEYISPFFFLEIQTLLKLCPLEGPCALAFQIGTYFNETDWLFLVREEGNFRIEETAIRVFPRIPGVEYSGRIMESVEPSLIKLGVPIQVIPENLMQVLHEHGRRKERIERKAHIYKMLDTAGQKAVLSAIKDFSFIGRTEQTAEWLKRYAGLGTSPAAKLKMGLNLAKLFETSDPPQADRFYQDMMKSFPASREAILSYAEYLIMNGRMAELGEFDFEAADLKPASRKDGELRCLEALKYFESGNQQEAFDVLAEVLDSNAFQVLPQALRFYFMASLNDLQGAVSALDALFTLSGNGKEFQIEKLEDVFTISGELYSAMLKNSFRRESAIVLYGITKLGECWKTS